MQEGVGFHDLPVPRVSMSHRFSSQVKISLPEADCKLLSIDCVVLTLGKAFPHPGPQSPHLEKGMPITPASRGRWEVERFMEAPGT